MSDRYAMSVPSSESERRLQEIGRKYAHMIIPRSNEDVQLSDFRDTTEPDEGRNTMSDPIEMTAGADTLAWDIFRADNANVPESELRSDFPANAEYAINIAKHLRSAGYQKVPNV